MEEELRSGIETLKDISEGAVPPEISIEEAKAILKQYKEQEETISRLFRIIEASIPMSVIQDEINNLEEEFEQLEKRQIEIVGCDGDDTLTREEMWFVEDKIHLLKKLLAERH